LKQFETLFRSLADNPQIITTNMHQQRGLSLDELTAISNKYEVDIPSPVAKFYRQMDGASLEWEVRRETTIKPLTKVLPDALWGSFLIHDLDTLLGGSDDYPLWEGLLWFDDPELGPQNEHKRLRPFDFFAEDDTECGCLFVNHGKLTTTVYLHSVEDGIRPLSIDLQTYIDLLIASRGFYGWQTAYFDRSSRNYERLMHFVPQVFPDADLSQFTHES
jgi:hypothetical protein